jgi:3-oxoacyl-[acyl-carrier-protein] synthase III
MNRTLTARPSGHSRVLSFGAYRPRRLVPNAEVIEAIDSSDEWIQQRSGIKTRRWAAEDETVQMMAVAASRQALERAGVEAGDIDLVVVATITHLLQTPALATAVSYELGNRRAAAIDVSAACAGFCYGLAMASDAIRAGSATHALVIGVERLSDLTDLTDRGTAFLFADGAGAVVVGPSDVSAIGPVAWGADGGHFEILRQSETWREALTSPTYPQTNGVPPIVMEGNQVFRWASFEMAKVAQEALDKAGVSAHELDVFAPHQANMRITDVMARSMKLPDTVRIARDIADQGNTSAASIPLAIDTMYTDGEARSGDIALLIGFGAGLAYAAQVIILP